MRAKKSLGQHFLMHRRIAERIADAAEISKEETVLEIGPGTGMLTRPLLERAKKVIAIEADAELYGRLKNEFLEEIERGQLELYHADIRTFDHARLPRAYALVANIPYYLTGEILRRFLEAPRQPRSMTLLVQKEVAIRIARSKKESLLSLSIKAYGAPRYAFTVPRGAFTPAPAVDSAVITIAGISRKNFASLEEERRFFELLRAGFAHKRKKASSNLAAFGLPEDALPPNARAEDISLSHWLDVAKSQGK